MRLIGRRGWRLIVARSLRFLVAVGLGACAPSIPGPGSGALPSAPAAPPVCDGGIDTRSAAGEPPRAPAGPVRATLAPPPADAAVETPAPSGPVDAAADLS